MIKDIPELLEAGVISQETADRIREYYDKKGGNSNNRLVVVFGILGAILVGLGIILIIAHNWDELARSTKTVIAFIPLVAGQVLCGLALFKKENNTAWSESAAAFLFFGVGASISLVSQIYNIPGNLSSFLLTWMLLCLPLIYIMRSSIVSLLYLAGITYYAVESGYWVYQAAESYWYWILLPAILPHYYRLYRKKPLSNFMIFHNWIIPLSIIITLGSVAKGNGEYMFIAYFSLFGLFYLIGNLDFFTRQKARNNGYRVMGSAGTIVLMLMLSFDWFWEELRRNHSVFKDAITSPEFLAAIILSLAAGALFVYHLKRRRLQPISSFFGVFIVIFILGLKLPGAVVLMNILVFIIGILTIREGARRDNLGVLNYGLLIITALIICRFFDTDISFVLRGILFVSVGTGFFAANYRMLKKRKAND